jgi:hypothetical protein
MKCGYINEKNNEQCTRDKCEGDKKYCPYHEYSLLPIAKSCKTQCNRICDKTDERCVYERYKDIKFCKNHKSEAKKRHDSDSESESGSESESDSGSDDEKHCPYVFKKGAHEGKTCGAVIRDKRNKHCSRHSK